MVGTSVSGRTWEIQGTGHGEHREQVTGDTEDAGHRHGQEGDSRGRQTHTFVPGAGARQSNRASGSRFSCFSSSAPHSLSRDLVISLVIVGFPARGQTDQPHPFLLEADTKICPKVVGIPRQDGGQGPAARRCSGPHRDPRSVIIPWHEFVRLQSGATDQMRGPN